MAQRAATDKQQTKPPPAPPHPLANDAQDGGIHPPPSGGLARGAHRAAADLDADSISTMYGELQDAILEGLGLLDEELNRNNVASVVPPVLRGSSIFYSRASTSFVVWAAALKANVCFYCSCGAENGEENAAARLRMGVSSRCRHAVAFALALRGVAQHVLCASVADLLHRYATFDNSGATATHVTAVEVEVDNAGQRTHVVRYNGIWFVVKPPQTHSRRSLPVCKDLPCRKRRTYCLHSCAVKPPIAGYGNFDEASDS